MSAILHKLIYYVVNLSTLGGAGGREVKNHQNLVNVVYECPLRHFLSYESDLLK